MTDTPKPPFMRLTGFRTPPALDAIADKVLRYHPPEKGVSAKNRRTKRQMEVARRGDNDPTGENGLVAAARRIRAKPHAD